MTEVLFSFFEVPSNKLFVSSAVPNVKLFIDSSVNGSDISKNSTDFFVRFTRHLSGSCSDPINRCGTQSLLSRSLNLDFRP
jgi:hypothetical protein